MFVSVLCFVTPLRESTLTAPLTYEQHSVQIPLGNLSFATNKNRRALNRWLADNALCLCASAPWLAVGCDASAAANCTCGMRMTTSISQGALAGTRAVIAQSPATRAASIGTLVEGFLVHAAACGRASRSRCSQKLLPRLGGCSHRLRPHACEALAE